MCQEDTFGEVVHVDNITEKLHGEFKLRNISFGIGKGEVLALVGQTKHGRRRLCHILAGDTLPSTGKATLLNKWNVTSFKVGFWRIGILPTRQACNTGQF